MRDAARPQRRAGDGALGRARKIVGTSPVGGGASGRDAPLRHGHGQHRGGPRQDRPGAEPAQPHPQRLARTADGRPTTDPPGGYRRDHPAHGRQRATRSGGDGHAPGLYPAARFSPACTGPTRAKSLSGAGHFVIAMNIEAFQRPRRVQRARGALGRGAEIGAARAGHGGGLPTREKSETAERQTLPKEGTAAQETLRRPGESRAEKFSGLAKPAW